MLALLFCVGPLLYLSAQAEDPTEVLYFVVQTAAVRHQPFCRKFDICFESAASKTQALLSILASVTLVPTPPRYSSLTQPKPLCILSASCHSPLPVDLHCIDKGSPIILSLTRFSFVQARDLDTTLSRSSVASRVLASSCYLLGLLETINDGDESSV